MVDRGKSSAAARQWIDGAGVRRRHLSRASRRRGLIIGSPVRRQDHEVEDRTRSSHGDPEGRVHGGWLAAASHGGPEGCVHGSFQLIPSLGSKEALGSLLDNIEACLNPLASELFPDNSMRLDKYLAAAKQLNLLLLLLQQQPSDEASSDINERAQSLLKKAMSWLAMEFCHLRIWRLDALRNHLGVSPASIWESVRRSCSNGASSDSEATWSSHSATSCTSSSDGAYYLSAQYEEMSVRSDRSAFSGMHFIDQKELYVLNNIAHVMIEAGYEDMLRRAIDRHCYVEVLDIDNILVGHKAESKEMLLKVWIMATRIIASLLSEMQRQLNGQDLCPFNKLKEDYFLAIAKLYVMKMLKSASSVCTGMGPPVDPLCKDTYAAVKPGLSKMVNVVMMYQALNYTMPTILALFSGQTKEFICAEGEGLTNGLSDMFINLSVRLIDLVRSLHLVITCTGVHCSTRHVMDHLRVLVQHKTTIYLMLNGDLKAFSELVTDLISSLEFMLDMNSRSLQHKGQQQIFLLNNVHFMLQEANKDIDLGRILGEEWLLQHHDHLNLFIARYVDASWTPVMSCFVRRTRVPEILWPHQLFDKFTSSFEMTFQVHKTWKVTDPMIRQKVRQAISQKVIPEYRMHIENYSEKKQKFAKYSIEQLESQLQELFEG